MAYGERQGAAKPSMETSAYQEVAHNVLQQGRKAREPRVVLISTARSVSN